jgi:hypothetical protein
MEIIVTAFATLVAAGCFLAVVASDIKESRNDVDSSGTENNTESTQDLQEELRC